MMCRVAFSTQKFKVVVPKSGKKYSKPRYKGMYAWLASELSRVKIQHKLIDLDASTEKTRAGKKSGKRKQKTKPQYGYTILVMLKTRYQLVCGWFPTRGAGDFKQGAWGIEIYKERGFWDRYLFRNRLTKRDALVKVILDFLASEGCEDMQFLSERALK